MDNGRTHEPNLREVTAELNGLRVWITSELNNIKALIGERHDRYNERDVAREKAIGKAEAAQEAYNVLHNDLARKMDEQNKATMPRLETEQRFRAIEQKIAENRNMQTGHIGQTLGGQIVKDEGRANIALFIAIGMLISSFAALVITYLN